MKKALSIVGYVSSILLFFYIRLPSLLAHSVAYTYDQGRDFMAGAHIVLSHDIPFIGPTTGINGLFHGSWWYYLLSVPYLIFHGAPIGYYWFNFFIQFTSLVVLMVFLKKEFGTLVSLLFGLFVALAPYFIFMSLFVGNNSMVLPSLLTLLICSFYLFKDKKASSLLLFVTGLSLVFVGEFELSFGILLLPLYFVAVLLFKPLRNAIFQKKGLFFLLGLIVGFAPRILFEFKNSFSQTRVLFSFLFHPKFYNNPAPYLNRFNERLTLFKEYYFEMFSQRFCGYVFLVSLFTITILIIISLFKKKIKRKPVLFFYLYLLSGLFFLSTLYKDFFWKNYYEGIHYIFLFIFISLVGQNVGAKYLQIKRAILMSICCGLGIIALISIRGTFLNSVPFDGLQVQETVTKSILKNQDQSKAYCLRIYTPSVIPHTYNYLFLINKMKPSSEWVNGTCWFIVESDSYKKRRDDWLEVNEPKDKYEVSITRVKDVEIRYYRVLPNNSL